MTDHLQLQITIINNNSNSNGKLMLGCQPTMNGQSPLMVGNRDRDGTMGKLNERAQHASWKAPMSLQKTTPMLNKL